MDPNNPHWGRSWLERWMASRPWESRSATDRELNSDRASVNSATSHAISVGARICWLYSRVPTKITCDECNKKEASPNRTKIIVPNLLKITKDELKSIVPTKIINDDYKSKLQSSTNIDTIKIANDKCIKLRGLQNRNKLCLVLDLDHTLLHSKSVCELSPEKAKFCLDNVADHKNDIFRWKTTNRDLLIKLRPFVRKFLEEANKLFEMHIYTMGSRDYALHIASLLDPKSIYFGSRIISREKCTTNGQKGLDVVPVDESGILILDDQKRVWSRNLRNLIVIEEYRYFRSLSEESEIAGSLFCALKLLQEVHNLYFGRDNMLDVRVLLGNILTRRTEMGSGMRTGIDYGYSSHHATKK